MGGSLLGHLLLVLGVIIIKQWLSMEFKISRELENEWKLRQLIFLWQHSAINYINDRKSLEESVAMANKKYGVNFDESLLMVY